MTTAASAVSLEALFVGNDARFVPVARGVYSNVQHPQPKRAQLRRGQGHFAGPTHWLRQPSGRPFLPRPCKSFGLIPSPEEVPVLKRQTVTVLIQT
jgi:hypothetical protein